MESWLPIFVDMISHVFHKFVEFIFSSFLLVGIIALYLIFEELDIFGYPFDSLMSIFFILCIDQFPSLDVY